MMPCAIFEILNAKTHFQKFSFIFGKVNEFSFLQQQQRYLVPRCAPLLQGTVEKIRSLLRRFLVI